MGAALMSAALVTSLAVAAPATAETLLDRGNYLVNAVMACDICHTPRGPNGLLMDKRFSGGSQTWDEPTYRVKGANITPDRDTGISTSPRVAGGVIAWPLAPLENNAETTAECRLLALIGHAGPAA